MREWRGQTPESEAKEPTAAKTWTKTERIEGRQNGTIPCDQLKGKNKTKTYNRGFAFVMNLGDKSHTVIINNIQSSKFADYGQQPLLHFTDVAIGIWSFNFTELCGQLEASVELHGVIR